MHKDEIQSGELFRYAAQLEAAVEDVCRSQPFRTSAKSCEFLRHVVRQTLNGNVDELKERLIGITLLGRDVSYDTGSDAAVRVRANDVRKRLATYYAADRPDEDFLVELPTGSYVPRFYSQRSSPIIESEPTAPPAVPASALDSSPELMIESPLPSPATPKVRELSLLLLALPTLVALFLCLICVRWQLTQEHPFASFWNTVFQEHRALFYVPISRPYGQQEVIPADRLEDDAPLFNLAGRFHARLTLTRSLSAGGGNDILILIGDVPNLAATDGERLAVESSSSGRRIVDRAAAAGTRPYGEAALLTIFNGPHRFIHVDGTDGAAIASLIHDLSDPSGFPEDLVDSFHKETVTQIVFPMTPGAPAVVFHEPLPTPRIAMSKQP